MKLLSAALYIVGLSWLSVGLIYLSLSTNELKPRQLFVDEHAIPVKSVQIRKQSSGENLLYQSYHFEEENSIYVKCSDIFWVKNASNLYCTELMDETSHALTQLIVSSNHSPKSHENTLLIFHYNQYTFQLTFNTLIAIISKLNEAKWIARQIVILLIPSTPSNVCSSDMTTYCSSESHPQQVNFEKNLSSDRLEKWIRCIFENESACSFKSFNNIQEHKLNIKTFSQYYFHKHSWKKIGMLREAYIIDLQSLPKNNDNKLLQFQLKYHGDHGLLSNMDMISYPLNIFPRMITTKPLNTAESVCGQLQIYLTTIRKQVANRFPAQENSILMQSIDYLIYQLGREKVDLGADMHRWCGYVQHQWQALLGGDGWHRYFIARNIDAITLVASLPATLQQQDASVVRDLYFLAMQLVYMSNSIEEELHHSYFIYIIMGDRHFTAISELGLVGLVMLSPLIVKFLQHWLASVRTESDSLLPSWKVMICVAWLILLILPPSNIFESFVTSKPQFTTLWYFLWCIIPLIFLNVAKLCANQVRDIDCAWITSSYILVLANLACRESFALFSLLAISITPILLILL